VRQRELVIIQPPLDVEVRFDQVLVALALGALNGLMLELQPGTNRLKLVGGVGPATVRNQGVRHPVAQTRGIGCLGAMEQRTGLRAGRGAEFTAKLLIFLLDQCAWFSFRAGRHPSLSVVGRDPKGS
jgi:hypothetical protein